MTVLNERAGNRSPAVTPGGRDALGFSLLCGLVGLLGGLHAFAGAVLPHILTTDGYNFQEVIDGLPVPRLLDWNTSALGLLQEYANLHPLLCLLVSALVLGLLWYQAVKLVSPEVRLFRHQSPIGPPTEEEIRNPPPANSALDGTMLRRIALSAGIAAIPCCIAWRLGLAGSLRFPSLSSVIMAVTYAAAGEWSLSVLHPDGLIGRMLPLTESNLHRGASGHSWAGICLRGAVLGLFVWIIQYAGLSLPSQTLLGSLHALGTFNVAQWNSLALHYMLCVATAWFGGGLFLWLLVRERSKTPFWLIALLLLCVPFASTMRQPFNAKALALRNDITPEIMKDVRPYRPEAPASGVPNGMAAGKQLSRVAGVPLGNQPAVPARRFLLFTSNGAYNGLQQGYTEDGLTADPASVPKVQAYLRGRRYRTTLSWTAFKFVYNVGNVHFDNSLALRAALDDLENCPHSTLVSPTVRAMLFTVSASRANLLMLDEWADEARFSHPDRASRKLMGDLYLRFGETKRALEWYTRADMPHSFMAKIRGERPLFHTGKIHGALYWNGKPLAGVQVGGLPKRQNGLPKDLEGSVFAAETELFPFRGYSPIFGPLQPRPYSFRWISTGTVTDSKGEFTLDNLTEGTYHLLCTLPPNVTLEDFRDMRLNLNNSPGDLMLSYRTPVSESGRIELTFHP